jgi:hypothetical protein
MVELEVIERHGGIAAKTFLPEALPYLRLEPGTASLFDLFQDLRLTEKELPLTRDRR